MGLSYDPGARKWNLVYEKTDYPVPDTKAEKLEIWIPDSQGPNVYSRNPLEDPVWRAQDAKMRANTNMPQPKFTKVEVNYNQTPEEIGKILGKKYREIARNPENITQYEKNNNNTVENLFTGVYKGALDKYYKKYAPEYYTEGGLQDFEVRLKNLDLLQKEKEKLAKQTIELNNKNTSKNTAYDKTLATVNSTRGGDYVLQRDIIRKLEGLGKNEKKTLEDYYKAFYTTEKLQTWDTKLGAKAPYGEFDPNYYKKQNPEVAQEWAKAVANDDVDITQRYGETNYYLQHYTNVGKNLGLRANKAENLAAAQVYKEEAPTDKELQQVRNLQLGVDTETQTDRLLKVPEIAAEWNKAKAGDSYWKEKAKEYFLDINKPDEFAALFRLSDRPEDKQIAFKYNANADYGITELEDALNAAVGEKVIVDVKRFGALAQDVLKQTVEEMKKAKAREQELSMFSGFSAFKEITGINQDLTSSILGDSGVGGVLSFMGGSKAEEQLEKSLRGITGVNNNVTYNWQQWFDDTLKKRYETDLELGLTKEQAEEKVKVQGEFAREFIDKYLTPRFNESRSMDEFVEYLDVRQEEQNPFQTQDIMNAAKLVADIRAQQYLDQLKKTPDRYFDSTFYFNPTGNKGAEAKYQDQANTVTADWEAAKKGDSYWATQAYRFGVDVNDKDAFARMHFQVKGQGKGYDGADDILNASKVSDYIYGQILPALNKEALKQGTVFGQFIRPEEFAEEMLKGVDPTDKEQWDEILKQYGLTDFKGTVEELKQYITEALRTGTAQDIREQLKYLNEKKRKPTQEVLGVTYIQREEDYKPDAMIKGDTELYKVFQSAGYQGTEDEFYENFFPDLDRSQQVALTKAGSNEALKTTGLDLKDPFASLGTIESFFSSDDDDSKQTEEKSTSERGYFTIDDDEDILPRTKSGQGFLDEFTSMFKGFG